MSYQFSNVSFTLSGKRPILSNITGSFQPRELTCILGASGAGKTSLLNILSGRLQSTKAAPFTGKLLLDGVAIIPHQMREQFAYVMQDDALYANQTPRESILLTAKLRKVPQPEKAVNNVLESLGLEKCADSYCGSDRSRGISGGERKRTAIAVEIVSDPKLLFMDEPTTGLDSHSAYNVINTLRTLTRQGMSIALTLHQPSSEIFHLCDKVIFLQNSHIVYSGPVSAVAEHFAACGYINPPNYNISDYITFLLNTESDEALNTLRMELNARMEISFPQQPAAAIAFSETKLEDYTVHTNRKSPLHTQIQSLFLREFTDTIRDTTSLSARFGITAFSNVLLGVVFFQKGDAEIRIHFSALIMTCINLLFSSANPEVFRVPCIRPVFIREHISGLYSTAGYVIAKTCVDVPILLLQSLVCFASVYWLVGLKGFFPLLVLLGWLLALCASSLGFFLGAFVGDVSAATQWATVVLMPQLLFSGFFLPITDMLEPLQNGQYICFFKYLVNLFAILEFDASDDVDVAKLDDFFDSQTINRDHWWIYLGVGLLVFIGLRAITCVALSLSTRGGVY